MEKNRNPDPKKFTEWHQVSNIRYLGPVRFRALHKALGGKVGRIFELSRADLVKMKGIVTPQVLLGIEEQRTKRADSEVFVREQLALAEKNNVRILFLDDADYPRFLLESKMSHPIIYCKGDLKSFRDFRKSVAIVGTRKAAAASIQIARKMATTLAKEGWVIVSGMAKGIDSEAHDAALAAGGKTIAVLGSGVEKPYPKECSDLYFRILAANLVVSEYPIGSKPEALRLKKRNKTTVALSLGAFAVQSAEDGGTMNAVRGCEEQNKPVFTVWGEGPEFSGNRKIIKDGGVRLDEPDAAETLKRICLEWAKNPPKRMKREKEE